MFGARMRRILCWGMAAGLTASTLGGILLPTPSVAVVGPGPAAAAAANWLVQQLNADDLLEQGGEPDITLTMDAVLSLTNVGGHDTEVDAMRAAVAGELVEYVEGDFNDDSNAVALAAVYAVRIGEDPTNFGGLNLVAELENRITDDPAGDLDGRLTDLPGGLEPADTIGQAAAVEALAAVSSQRAEDAVAFLLKQSCGFQSSDGFFRKAFASDVVPVPSQQCVDDIDDPTPDTASTAAAITALRSLNSSDSGLVGVRENAENWLLITAGREVGAWSRDGNSATAKDAETTSRAGVAIAPRSLAAATKPALWVRGLQAYYPAPCVTGLTSETGAVALERPNLLEGELDGITDDQVDSWVRATTYATDLLKYEDSTVGRPMIAGPTGYVEARKPVTLTVSKLDIGERVCVSGPAGNPRLISAKATTMAVVLYTPRDSGRRTFQVRGLEGSDTHAVVALDQKKLDLKIGKFYVKRGAKQKISVSGLAAGERVTVKVKGSKLIKGVASATGKFSKKFKVKAKRGKVKITVTGQFASRTNRIPFKVL